MFRGVHRGTVPLDRHEGLVIELGPQVAFGNLAEVVDLCKRLAVALDMVYVGLVQQSPCLLLVSINLFVVCQGLFLGSRQGCCRRCLVEEVSSLV